MSNVYVILKGRLVDNPKFFEGGIGMCDIRIADNPARKTNKDGTPAPARFISCKVFGPQGKLAARLAKGDVIAAVGELGLEAYKDKAGVERTKDVMTVQRYEVHKSETFFDKNATDGDLPF